MFSPLCCRTHAAAQQCVLFMFVCRWSYSRLPMQLMCDTPQSGIVSTHVIYDAFIRSADISRTAETSETKLSGSPLTAAVRSQRTVIPSPSRCKFHCYHLHQLGCELNQLGSVTGTNNVLASWTTRPHPCWSPSSLMVNVNVHREVKVDPCFEADTCF
jgi:hypothetical protein